MSNIESWDNFRRLLAGVTTPREVFDLPSAALRQSWRRLPTLDDFREDMLKDARAEHREPTSDDACLLPVCSEECDLLAIGAAIVRLCRA